MFLISKVEKNIFDQSLPEVNWVLSCHFRGGWQATVGILDKNIVRTLQHNYFICNCASSHTTKKTCCNRRDHVFIIVVKTRSSNSGNSSGICAWIYVLNVKLVCVIASTHVNDPIAKLRHDDGFLHSRLFVSLFSPSIRKSTKKRVWRARILLHIHSSIHKSLSTILTSVAWQLSLFRSFCFGAKIET